MSNADNKTHGGKGVNTPKAEADKNFREAWDAIDWSRGKDDNIASVKPRINHSNTQALPVESFSGYIKSECTEDCE